MLLPLEIQNKIFSKSLSGYDRSEVDEFLDQVYSDYEALHKENFTLREKVSHLEEGMDTYKNMEHTMQEALVVAQKTEEDVKQAAQEKAEIIVDRATQKSREIIDNANEELSKIRLEYEQIQKEIEIFKTKTVASLSAVLTELQKEEN